MRGPRDREPAEEPLWARAEAEAATFALRRVGGRRRPGVTLAVVVVAALAAVIAIGSAGGNRLGGPDAAQIPGVSAMSPSPAPSLPVAVRPPAIGRVEAGLGTTPVVLTLPARSDALINGSTITVSGELAVHATTLRIELEVDRLHRLGSVTLDATDPNGGLRPDYPLRFLTDLAIPMPRPAGRAWLVITAFNRAGEAIGTLRESVEISPRLVVD